MPVQKIAWFEGLNKILECRKTDMGLVVIIVGAARRRMRNHNIEYIPMQGKVPKQLGDKGRQAGIHLRLGILVGTARSVTNAAANPGDIQTFDRPDRSE